MNQLQEIRHGRQISNLFSTSSGYVTSFLKWYYSQSPIFDIKRQSNMVLYIPISHDKGHLFILGKFRSSSVFLLYDREDWPLHLDLRLLH